MTLEQREHRAWRTGLMAGTCLRSNATNICVPPLLRRTPDAEPPRPDRRRVLDDLVRWSNDHTVVAHLHPRHLRAAYEDDAPKGEYEL